MATKKSIKRFYQQWLKQPPQMTQEDADAIDSITVDPAGPYAVWRRVGLGSLTRSAKQLVEAAHGQDTASAVAQAIVRVEEYAGHLKDLTGMMEAASERMRLSLCHRADMARLLEMARCDSEQVIR